MVTAGRLAHAGRREPPPSLRWANTPASRRAWRSRAIGWSSPLPVPGSTPLPTPSPTPAYTNLSNWDIWMLYLFGK